MSRLRPPEWLLLVYFLYVAAISPFYFAPWKAWTLTAIVIGAILALSRTNWILRDLAPLAYTLAAYREMNWFTPARHDHAFERIWIVWDRWLLNDFHVRAAIESIGSLFPLYFELCYVLVYAVAPVSVAILFATRHRDRISLFWVAYIAGTFGAYALFPYFPSEPPRIVFTGADLPTIVTGIRRFNLWILGGYGIHSSVFPSAHVSSALSAAWGLLAAIPDRRWIAWSMAFYGFSVAVATVYGRYHYGADAVAGVAVSLLAAVAIRLYPGKPAQDQHR